jgi:hypothetical protein
MILEAKDVQFFEVPQTQSQPHVAIAISGLAFHGSMIVDNISTQMEGDTMHVYVCSSRAVRPVTFSRHHVM